MGERMSQEEYLDEAEFLLGLGESAAQVAVMVGKSAPALARSAFRLGRLGIATTFEHEKMAAIYHAKEKVAA